MEASTIVWDKWQEQLSELLPEVHRPQKKTLALSVLGIVLSGSAVLPRMTDQSLFAGHQSQQDAKH